MRLRECAGLALCGMVAAACGDGTETEPPSPPDVAYAVGVTGSHFPLDSNWVHRLKQAVGLVRDSGKLATLAHEARERLGEGVVAKLVEALSGPSAENRRLAALALAGMGVEAVDAAGALVAALDTEDPDTEITVAVALLELAPHSVPALIDALILENEWLHLRVTELIHQIGSPAAPVLRERLGDPSPAIRCEVAALLANSERFALAAAPDLTIALRDEVADVRVWCAAALGTSGSSAAVEPLVGALEDSNAAVREAAAHALGALGPTARTAAAALRRLADDPDPDVRAAAADALERIRS